MSDRPKTSSDKPKTSSDKPKTSSDRPKTSSPKDNADADPDITLQTAGSTKSRGSKPTVSSERKSRSSRFTKDTAQKTIPDHPDPSSQASTGGAYIDFGQLHAPDDITDVRSDFTPVGIAKARR